MKIRNGYVSNSSSSSFLVIGYEICDIFDEKKDLDFKHNYYVYLGKDVLYDEGLDMIELNQEIYDWLNEHKWQIKDMGIGTIIKVIALNENDCMDIPNDIKDAKVWSLNVSYHCSETIKDLEERYQ